MAHNWCGRSRLNISDRVTTDSIVTACIAITCHKNKPQPGNQARSSVLRKQAGLPAAGKVFALRADGLPRKEDYVAVLFSQALVPAACPTPFASCVANEFGTLARSGIYGGEYGLDPPALAKGQRACRPCNSRSLWRTLTGTRDVNSLAVGHGSCVLVGSLCESRGRVAARVSRVLTCHKHTLISAYQRDTRLPPLLESLH